MIREGKIEIAAVLTHWNNDFSSGYDKKQALCAGQVEIMERLTGVNLDLTGLTSLCRRKSRDLKDAKAPESRHFLLKFAGMI